MIKILKKLNILLDKKQKVTMLSLVIMMAYGAGLRVRWRGYERLLPVGKHRHGPEFHRE